MIITLFLFINFKFKMDYTKNNTTNNGQGTISGTNISEFNNYIKLLSKDERQNFLKELGSQLKPEDLATIKKGSSQKRKQNLLKKYRNTWKTVRCIEDDLDEEWINNWWTNNKMTNKNLIQVGYQDIILGCSNDNTGKVKSWNAITGTDCEWFIEQSTLKDMINEVMYHNSSGVNEWGDSTIGGGHQDVNRIFIGIDSVKYFESNAELEVLKNRYKKVYIMDYYNPF